MENQDKIQGERLNQLLGYLIEHKTILSVRLNGTDYEQLTYIVGIESSDSQSHLIIDLPDGFTKIACNVSPWQLSFNFHGPDQLEHLFSVRGGALHAQGVRIPCPEYIDRIQRRKNFRVMTPVEARMVLTTPTLKGILNLVNIGLGGTYGTISKHNCKNKREPLLKVRTRINKLGIIFPPDDEMPEQIIVIKEALVSRIDYDKQRNTYKYAFEFVDIKPNQLKKLIQAIYHIQRQFLIRH